MKKFILLVGNVEKGEEGDVRKGNYSSTRGGGGGVMK